MSGEKPAKPSEGKDDDRAPEELARHAENIYTKKTEIPAGKLFVLALLAGAYIAFGSIFSQVALAGAETLPFGVGQLLAGLAFSLGLILVMVCGAELFTGNTLMIIPRAQERATTGEVLRAWGIAYGGNLIGSLLIVFLFVIAEGHAAGDGNVGLAALETANRKCELAFLPTLSSGILANMLVCLAVWLALSARSTEGKVIAIIAPITAFVAGGFEHSVANMSLIPLGMAIAEWADPEFWSLVDTSRESFGFLSIGNFLGNLLWSTIGNIIGGGLIGFAYWSGYRRTSD